MLTLSKYQFCRFSSFFSFHPSFQFSNIFFWSHRRAREIFQFFEALPNDWELSIFKIIERGKKELTSRNLISIYGIFSHLSFIPDFFGAIINFLPLFSHFISSAVHLVVQLRIEIKCECWRTVEQ